MGATEGLAYAEEQVRETIFSTFIGSVRGAATEFGGNVRLNLHYLSLTFSQARQSITAAVGDIFMFDFMDKKDVMKIESGQ